MYTLPNVLNKLEDIKDIKSEISNALVNRGQNMVNVPFTDYPEKVENLKCKLSYISYNNAISTDDIYKSFSMINFSLFTSTHNTFSQCINIIDLPNIDTSNVTNMANTFVNCVKLVDIPQLNTSKVTNMYRMFQRCNNLSNTSIQNIINMCLNSNVTNSTLKNTSNVNGYSPFYQTNIAPARYNNRFSELTAAGWTH